MTPESPRGTIAWFARNPVAANLLMIVVVALGLGSAFNIQRAMFPSMEIDLISIVMPYPGAAPEEVEQGVVLKIEDAINDVDGIKRVESDSIESMAQVWVEPHDGVDIQVLLDDIKSRIDAIQHFPREAEKPVISRPEMRSAALQIQISGDLDERSMTSLAEEIRRELMSYPEISAAEVVGARDYEIAIEISEQSLREYHLTLGDVAHIISASSLDLPSGSVQTENGEILLRTIGQAYVQRDFETVVLKTWPDGTRLLLGDIATVNDGFVDATGFVFFNGKYSLGIRVYAIGEQDIVDTANAAKRYAEQKRGQLAEGISLEVWADITYYLQGRLGMMLKNLAMGALLVFVVLALFLQIKLAFWVTLGIPVCFLGAMTVINTPYVGASLNMVSIFGFILVLGIVVDDAIIMGESAYAEQERFGHSVDSVINGVHRVSTPATFGVLTTIVAFAPTLFVDGLFAAIPEACGFVVISCLLFSLIESKWILPAHLAHSKPIRNRLLLQFDHIQESVNQKLVHFVQYYYSPIMLRCVKYRYVTLAFFLSLLILAVGLLAGGVVRTILAPDVQGEFLTAKLQMSQGTAEERTFTAIADIVNALSAVEADYQSATGSNARLVAHVYSYSYDRVHGLVSVELTKEDQRSISTREIKAQWRDKVGIVHGAEVLDISSKDGPGFGPSVAFDLTHKDFDTLRLAAEELEEAMRLYEGLYDFRNGASDTRDEFHLDILPEAESLGLTRLDLGTQVRHAFYGAEAQRVQRGIDELKVMVRYPKTDRESVSSLNDMFIRTPTGDEVPFESVARVEIQPGLLKTTHINFQRAAEVTAEANKAIVEPSKVLSDLETRVLPALAKKYPGLEYARSGASGEEIKLVRSLVIGFAFALFGIYALLAIPTKSYLQPLIIMGVIPFGVIGAIVGHWLTGFSFNMMSVMGVIALSGVVVNDSLILVDYVNKAVAGGTPSLEAMVQAGTRRFRAILLTSLTTFFGLAPMLLERSVQAQEIIPMAISLAFGIVFATVITLLLVPCLYFILTELDRWWNGTEEPAAALPTHDAEVPSDIVNQ